MVGEKKEESIFLFVRVGLGLLFVVSRACSGFVFSLFACRCEFAFCTVHVAHCRGQVVGTVSHQKVLTRLSCHLSSFLFSSPESVVIRSCVS